MQTPTLLYLENSVHRSIIIWVKIDTNCDNYRISVFCLLIKSNSITTGLFSVVLAKGECIQFEPFEHVKMMNWNKKKVHMPK